MTNKMLLPRTNEKIQIVNLLCSAEFDVFDVFLAARITTRSRIEFEFEFDLPFAFPVFNI